MVRRAGLAGRALAARDAVEPENSTRAQILSGAARLFRTQGYAAVSLRDIAKAVGVTTGSLYHHFASKEEIVSEILEQGHLRVLREVKRNVEALGASATGTARLREAIYTHLSCLTSDDSFPSANIRIFAHVPAEVRLASLGARHEYEKYWATLLANFRDKSHLVDIDPVILVNLLFGAMNWTIEWFNPRRHSLDTIAGNLTLLVVPDTT